MAANGGHPAFAAVRRHVECYAGFMTIKARVRDERLVVDEPTTLPDGTELELLPVDQAIGSTMPTARPCMRRWLSPRQMSMRAASGRR